MLCHWNAWFTRPFTSNNSWTCKWNKGVTQHSTIKSDELLKKKMHSQQLRPQDHRHLFAWMVATEMQTEKMACASLPWAEHAGSASDGRQVEILRLAGAHPDLVPESVVYHVVTLLAERDTQLQLEFTFKQVELLVVQWHSIPRQPPLTGSAGGFRCAATSVQLLYALRNTLNAI